MHKIEVANGGMIFGRFSARADKARVRPAKADKGRVWSLKTNEIGSNSNDSPCQRPWPGDAIEDGDRKGRQ